MPIPQQKLCWTIVINNSRNPKERKENARAMTIRPPRRTSKYRYAWTPRSYKLETPRLTSRNVFTCKQQHRLHNQQFKKWYPACKCLGQTNSRSRGSVLFSRPISKDDSKSKKNIDEWMRWRCDKGSLTNRKRSVAGNPGNAFVKCNALAINSTGLVIGCINVDFLQTSTEYSFLQI